MPTACTQKMSGLIRIFTPIVETKTIDSIPISKVTPAIIDGLRAELTRIGIVASDEEITDTLCGKNRSSRFTLVIRSDGKIWVSKAGAENRCQAAGHHLSLTMACEGAYQRGWMCDYCQTGYTPQNNVLRENCAECHLDRCATCMNNRVQVVPH